MLLQLSQFSSLCLPPPSSFPPAIPSTPLLSSCPWVAHISSLASSFPILFLTSRCLFCTNQLYFFLKYFILFILRERGKDGEGGGEKYKSAVASSAAPTGDLAHNPGMCSDGIKLATLWFSGWQSIH